MSLKKEASVGILWVIVERFGQQILQIVIFIILARLLTPEDFGLIGMLLIFLAIGQSFIDSGMGQALIREKKITDQDRSTVFWFNLLLSISFYGLLFVSAPYVAKFYEQAELLNITRVMGLVVIFFGIAVVQRSEMTQKLQFKKQAYAQLPSVIIAGLVSITMAYLNYGVWSLVAQSLIGAACSSIALWVIQPATIRFQFDKESFSRLFGFGYKLLLSGLLETTYQHIYKLVIGKYYSASTLGFYIQANKIQELASKNLVAIIQKVTYPLLSKASDNCDRLKRGYRQIIQSSSFVIFPAMLLLMVFAEPIMVYILGEQWTPAAPYLQIICASGILYHLHAINLNILKVLGRSDLFLKLEIFKKTNTTIAILVGLEFGIYGLLIGQVISSYIALFINTWYTSKFLDYKILEQGVDVFKVFILSIPMVTIMATLMFFLPIWSIFSLFAYLFLACLIYIGSNLLFQTEIIGIIIVLVSPILPKKWTRNFKV